MNTCPVGVATQNEELRKRFHGRYEYCSLTTMHKAMQVILNLAQLWTK